MKPHVLIARPDSVGDVLLSGPAVRAVAARAGRVTFLAGPRGAEVAGLLPGVDEVMVAHIPWIDPEPRAVSRPTVLRLAHQIAYRRVDEALILTSFHQSPLPTALILKLAGIGRVAAISEDYPGSLLDVRLPPPGDVHEVTRGLLVASGLGYSLPPDDDGRLRLRRRGALPSVLSGLERFIAVHPGASVPARAWAPERHARLVQRLRDGGWPVVVTGAPGDRALTARIVGRPRQGVHDLGGATNLPALAQTIAAASALVAGNTGPAHLAAAVGTPVVSLFAPTVPAARWRPWKVPHVLLHAPVPCAGCRARECPISGHPCLERISVETVASAVNQLAGQPSTGHEGGESE